MNDLWKYNPGTSEWTWMKGDSVPNISGVYGVRNVADINNNPGARESASFWTDPDGTFWMYGGRIDNSGVHNDLWKFNPVTSEWTWMKGHVNSSNGLYKTKGVELPEILPQGRNSAYQWVDSKGNLWLFGGHNVADSGWLNDMWQYNRCTNNWSWVTGDSTSNSQAVYGVQGVASSLNTPRSRSGGLSWSDKQGSFWLMGGVGGTYIPSLRFGAWGDLWKYIPETRVLCNSSLPVHLVAFTGRLHENGVNLQWLTENEINFDYYVVERSYDSRTFEPIGSITGRGSSLRHSYDYFDPNAFTSSNNKAYYRLKIIDKDGRFRYSSMVLAQVSNNKFNIYPNPATKAFKIETDKTLRGTIELKIIDAAGRVVLKNSYTVNGNAITIATDEVLAGIYTVKIVCKDEKYLKKLVIIK